MIIKWNCPLTSCINSNLLTGNNFNIQFKLSNPKIFIKEVFYLFEYAAISQNEYYNHLAFSYIEQIFSSASKAKIHKSNWSVLLISLYLTEFNRLGYFNLAISKIYEKADEICILISKDKSINQDLLILALIYLEQRAKEAKPLIPILKANRNQFLKRNLVDSSISFDHLLKSTTLLKLLSSEKNDEVYVEQFDLGLNCLKENFEKEERSTLTIRNMIFLFEDTLNFANNNYWKAFINRHKISFKERFLLSDLLQKSGLEKKSASFSHLKIATQVFEEELKTLSFVEKLDLGFEILMLEQKDTIEKRIYYSLLN